VEEYQRDPCVRRLFERRSLGYETMLQYLKGIRDFCLAFGWTPSELVEHFRSLDPDEAVKLFREYFVRRKSGLAPKSLWNWLGGVKALLIENDVEYIDIISKRIAREFRRTVGRVRRLIQRDLITKEELIKVLRIAELRERALIALLATSGIRINAALHLRLMNFVDDLYDTALPCYAIEVPEEISKEREAYITFITWEAAEYLRDWLEYRRSRGELIGRGSYLFTTQSGSPLSRQRFETIWRELCREAGIDLKPVTVPGNTGIRYNIRVHSLRKFFRTTLQISGVDRMVAEALMGHSLSQFGVESIYNYATSHIEYMKTEYLKALNALLFLRKPRGLEIINGEARKRIQELEEKLKQSEEEKRLINERLLLMERRLENLASRMEDLLLKLRKAEKHVRKTLKKKGRRGK